MVSLTVATSYIGWNETFIYSKHMYEAPIVCYSRLGKGKNLIPNGVCVCVCREGRKWIRY